MPDSLPANPPDNNRKVRMVFDRRALLRFGFASLQPVLSTTPVIASGVTEAEKAAALQRCIKAYQAMPTRFDPRSYVDNGTSLERIIYPDGTLPPGYVESGARWPEKKRREIEEGNAALEDFLKVCPQGMAFSYEYFGEFKEFIVDGILSPEKLRREFNYLTQIATKQIKLAEDLHREIASQASKEAKIATDLVAAIRKKAPGEHFDTMLMKTKEFIPPGVKWTDYLANPINLEEITEQVVAAQRKYKEKREYGKTLEEVRNDDKQTAEKLSMFFGRSIEVDGNGYFFLDVPSLSESKALHRTLHNVLTLRGRFTECSLPSEDKCCVIKLEDARMPGSEKSTSTWVARGVRVPPSGYALKIPRLHAQKLASIIDGKMEFLESIPDADRSSDVISYYRQIAEASRVVCNQLADDLDQLKTLIPPEQALSRSRA